MNKLQQIRNIFFKYKRKLRKMAVRNVATSLTNSRGNRISLKLLFFGSDNFSLQSLVRLNDVR